MALTARWPPLARPCLGPARELPEPRECCADSRPRCDIGDGERRRPRLRLQGAVLGSGPALGAGKHAVSGATAPRPRFSTSPVPRRFGPAASVDTAWSPPGLRGRRQGPAGCAASGGPADVVSITEWGTWPVPCQRGGCGVTRPAAQRQRGAGAADSSHGAVTSVPSSFRTKTLPVFLYTCFTGAST